MLLSLTWNYTPLVFFQCSYARFLWRAVQVSFGISIPANKDKLFSPWLRPNGPKTNTLLLVAAAALIWAIWLTRNEVILEKVRSKTFLQVLFRGTHWLRQWASLQRKDEHKDMLVEACRHLEVSALEFFGSRGWLSSRWIGPVWSCFKFSCLSICL